MIQEIRIYDMDGVKRFIEIDTNKLKDAVAKADGAISLANALEDAIVVNTDYHTPPSLFMIEFPMRGHEMRDYEEERIDRILRRSNRARTRLGALVERIECACARWLDR